MHRNYPLSDLQALRMKPGDKPISDGTVLGLYLFASAKEGAGKWIFRYKSPQTGKRREMGFGGFPSVSIDAARKKAEVARECLRRRLDPLEVKKQKGSYSAQMGRIPTFEVVARQYHSQISAGFRSQKHNDQWIYTLEKYVFPIIGKENLATLTPAKFASCLKPIWLAKPETARRVKERCAAVIRWALAHQYLTSDPIANVKALLPRQPTRRERVCHFPALPWRAIPGFIGGTLRSGGDDIHQNMLELVILTACRSGEIRRMQWDEIDFHERTFTIPASRMKAKVAHRVPLTPRVLQILENERNKSALRQGLVFKSRTGAAVTDMALTKILRASRVASDTKARFATTHGFRSSFRDWASENGHSGELADRTLAHSLRSAVEAAYHRTDLLEQRRMLMLQWENYCLQNVRSVDEDRRDAEAKQLDKLIAEAKAFRQAEEIRAYIFAVVDRCDTNSFVVDHRVRQWANWALREVDRIDPTNAKFQSSQN
ncbi:site-specific integrase [Neorhizobium sp. NCHU2750]|uniref:tyrosine-type recombinase/integrase n=1 Tax=Neorhizobium sp. NCHU2750 TaxID=1825976 RepID=UPI000E762367|nr:integrase [Neorhizobium sp. NCHU2750]